MTMFVIHFSLIKNLNSRSRYFHHINKRLFHHIFSDPNRFETVGTFVSHSQFLVYIFNKFKNERKMKRQLWGEISEKPDVASVQKQILIDQEIMMEKRGNIDYFVKIYVFYFY